ncbi:MAG: inorganic phosphate transporter [Chloroflexota bacterium]
MATATFVVLFLVACLYGIVSGFNDGGNLLASFTSGRVVSPKLALLILLVVPLGPIVVGTRVAATVGASIIDLPGQGAAGIAVITLISMAVVLLSWRFRIPTSMTLALVGAMLGWVLLGGAHSEVRWPGVSRVLVGMPVSVVGGGLASLGLYRGIRRVLGKRPNATVLRLARLQFLSAALQAFAYGANDLEKTVGLIGVARALPRHGAIMFDGPLPIGAAFASFAIGTLLGGWRVARRVGSGIVRVRPMEAFSQQLASGTVVALLATVGAPVSTTQTVGGGLVGVGVGVRASAVRWGAVRELLTSWLITLPLALLGALVLHLVLRMLGVVT